MASLSIEPSNLLSPAEYEKKREKIRAEIIALRQLRRVEVGPWVSLGFEDRQTVLYQIQEMIRIERIVDPEKVGHEIEAYADLLPGPEELSATLFIEIPEEGPRRAALSTLGGIERQVSLRCGSLVSQAIDKRPIDPDIERPGQATAVYYLGFPLNAALRAALRGGVEQVRLEINHPRYNHAAGIAPETRASLASGL